MLHRLAVEESETETLASQTSAATEDSEKLELDDKAPAMTAVYKDGEQRPASPSNSTTSSHKSGFHMPFRKTSGSSSSASGQDKKEDGLSRWLRDGTVVYKCVGLGLMDLVIGNHLVKVAREKKVGTQIPNF